MVKKAYVQGFDCETISLKKYVNMFERMEIAESIYEGVVTTSNKKTNREEANHTGISRNKRGEVALSNNHPAKDESTRKRSKRYVDCPKSARKHSMIHGLGHYSDEFKVLGKFGTKYAAANPTKNRGRNPTPKKGYHKKQYNHDIIDNMVDEIHMVESNKVSAVNHEAPELL